MNDHYIYGESKDFVNITGLISYSLIMNIPNIIKSNQLINKISNPIFNSNIDVIENSIVIVFSLISENDLIHQIKINLYTIGQNESIQPILDSVTSILSNKDIIDKMVSSVINYFDKKDL